MSTKLTGLDDEGMITSAGDTGTMVTDGSLIIGNSNTDSVTFNADVASNIIPDDFDAYSLGAFGKPWRAVYVSEGVCRRSQTGGGATTIGFVDPGEELIAITVPAAHGTMALDGMLPSFLSFGRNGSWDGVQTNMPLNTISGSQNGKGYRMPVGGVITHLSVQLDVVQNATPAGTEVRFELIKNGVGTGINISIAQPAVGDVGQILAIEPPEPFAPNDCLGIGYTSDLGFFPTAFEVDDIAVLVRILN
mgnify:CR=1 FL=1